VAKRADVLVARRKLGFGVEGRREHFVVVQSDLLSGLDTLVVAPLYDDGTVSRGDPLSVQVPADEAGTSRPQVVLVHLLTSALLGRFEATPSGRLSARSMARVDQVLRRALEL
jgi:mRNA-degrading endonuclease toxin of MazEF toxin-antitoxin module